MDNGVSIIICCFNSENRILDVLVNLDQINNLGFDIEIIVVDNASTDFTYNLAKDFFKTSKIIGSVIKESTQGLAFARKSGVLHAVFDIILFCDDDNFFEKDYIQNGLILFKQNLRLGVLGGFGVPISDNSFPYWFSTFSNSYAVGSLGKFDGIQPKGSIHYGACLFFRKDALTKYYNRNILSPLTGRKGKILSSGEDSELCLGIQLEGYSLGYDSSLRFKHKIEENRLSEIYCIKLKKGILSNYPILTSYEFLLKNDNSSYCFYLLKLFPPLLAGFVKTLINYIFDPDFKKKIYLSNFIFKLKGLFFNFFYTLKFYNQLKQKYK